MTDKELSKLRRTDLLELLIGQGKEMQALQEKLEACEKKLEDRSIVTQNAGSLADASIQLNNVIQAAQNAADQYMDNVRTMTEKQQKELEKRGTEANAAIDAQLAKANADCEALMARTKADSDRLRAEADSYAAEVRSKADADAEKLRGEVKRETDELRAKTRAEVDQLLADSQRKAAEIVENATREAESTKTETIRAAKAEARGINAAARKQAAETKKKVLRVMFWRKRK